MSDYHLNRVLYERAPAVAYRKAYERLTGTRLPPGPPLPAVPEVVAREPVDLEYVGRLMRPRQEGAGDDEAHVHGGAPDRRPVDRGLASRRPAGPS